MRRGDRDRRATVADRSRRASVERGGFRRSCALAARRRGCVSAVGERGDAGCWRGRAASSAVVGRWSCSGMPACGAVGDRRRSPRAARAGAAAAPQSARRVRDDRHPWLTFVARVSAFRRVGRFILYDGRQRLLDVPAIRLPHRDAGLLARRRIADVLLPAVLPLDRRAAAPRVRRFECRRVVLGRRVSAGGRASEFPIVRGRSPASAGGSPRQRSRSRSSRSGRRDIHRLRARRDLVDGLAIRRRPVRDAEPPRCPRWAVVAAACSRRWRSTRG